MDRMGLEFKAKVKAEWRRRQDLDNNETREQEGMLIAKTQWNANTGEPARYNQDYSLL